MNRDEALTAAAALINGPRANDYGPARKNFQDIADGWSVIVGKKLTAEDVALMMAWLKIARLAKSPTHVDSWLDACGYLALGCEIATEPDR